mgnify:CR=1 FL=1
MSELISLGDSMISRPDDMDPKKGLLEDGYRLTQAQAQSILDLRLHRLTGLEKEKIKLEKKRKNGDEVDNIHGIFTRRLEDT